MSIANPGFLLALVLAGQAARPLAEALKREDAQRHLSAGEENMRVEAFERAVREFRAAIELDPLLVLAYYNLGQAHMALKEYPEAVRAYQGCREAIERWNSLQQGQLIAREQEVDDQIRELEGLIRRLQQERTRDPGNRIMMVEARIRVLESTRRKGTDRRAVVPAELLLALGSAYFRQGAFDEAEREYMAAVKTDGRLGAAHNNLAVIYMLSGRFAESRQAIKKAEQAGFPVNPNLKRDLQAREKATVP